MFQRIKSQNGFTLIEFGAAIAIIGVLGVSVNQIARFNLLFVPAVQFGQGPTQCTADLKISDDAGGTLASSTVTLLPNQSRNVIFAPPVGAATGANLSTTGGADPTAVEIHAFATIPDCPDHTESCSIEQRIQQQACANNPRDFAGTLELADRASGMTLVVLPGVHLPAPQFPGFGSEQSMR